MYEPTFIVFSMTYYSFRHNFFTMFSFSIIKLLSMSKNLFLCIGLFLFILSSCTKSNNHTNCPLPQIGTITGLNNVSVGNTIILTDSVSGGQWSISNTKIATISSMGMVTGVATGTVVITYTLTNSCGTTTTTFSVSANTTLSIGQAYGGGIIAYILQNGDTGYDAHKQHGLIAAPTDQGTIVMWNNGTYITTGATGTAIGTGLSNTNAIIAAHGAGSYAATMCHNLMLSGYTNWYLPSRDELYKVYIHQTAIGGFTAANYWSSSEYSYSCAWYQFFRTGYQPSYYYKNLPIYVRAVRSF